MSDWVQLAALLFTIVVTLVGAAWAVARHLSGALDRVLTRLNDHERFDVERFTETNEAISRLGNIVRDEFGETIRALKEYVHQLELLAARAEAKNLDTFIRRESFFEVIKGVNANIEKLSARLEHVLDRIRELPGAKFTPPDRSS